MGEGSKPAPTPQYGPDCPKSTPAQRQPNREARTTDDPTRRTATIVYMGREHPPHYGQTRMPHGTGQFIALHRSNRQNRAAPWTTNWLWAIVDAASKKRENPHRTSESQQPFERPRGTRSPAARRPTDADRPKGEQCKNQQRLSIFITSLRASYSAGFILRRSSVLLLHATSRWASP